MIKLSLLEKEDFNKVIEWNINKSADDLLQWAGPIYHHPLTLAQVENHFFTQDNKENLTIIYKIQSIVTNEIIGTVELREIDKESKIGKVGRFLIGDGSMRGKGVGTKALKEILRIAFEEIKFQKVILSVFDFNHSAIRCYESVGFIKERFIENATKSSTGYWSSYEMGISNAVWQRNREHLEILKEQ